MDLKDLALNALTSLDAEECLWDGRVEKLEALIDRIEEEELRWSANHAKLDPGPYKLALLSLIPLSAMTAMAAFLRSRAAR